MLYFLCLSLLWRDLQLTQTIVLSIRPFVHSSSSKCFGDMTLVLQKPVNFEDLVLQQDRMTKVLCLTPVRVFPILKETLFVSLSVERSSFRAMERVSTMPIPLKECHCRPASPINRLTSECFRVSSLTRFPIFQIVYIGKSR